jgi:hypothetical protein
MAGAACAVLLATKEVLACGCFALPSPATPVVQAGERILFAKEGPNVVAHIQIQYSGAADQFGWIVPLPSVPTLELGTDEVFRRLDERTLPRFELTTQNLCTGRRSTSSGGFGCSADSAGLGGPPVMNMGNTDMGSPGPLVIESSIGPYDYAVLKADDQSDLFTWLSDNRYFVPAGTDEAIKPYIRPNAFLLALKLRAGESTGDIVPIVLRYQADLPMIPIVLTQVGAVPNMGILVWLLGEGRAVPRNYHHTVLNYTPIWFGNESYNALVVRATREAPARHTFITDYAGANNMKGVLLPPNRFGNPDVLRTFTEAGPYLAYLRNNGYPFNEPALLSILTRYIPPPLGLSPADLQRYYLQFDSFPAPGDRDGGAFVFDAGKLTDELWTRIVEPTRRADALFAAHGYLTRLYTTLSPEDMTADPVFGENRDLPDVDNVQRATVTIPCSGESTLITDQRIETRYTFGRAVALPGTLRLEVLREEGAPELVADNLPAIQSTAGPPDPDARTGDAGGCTLGLLPAGSSFFAGVFLVIPLILLRRRRR